MNTEHLSPKEATAKAMGNLGSALIAMSLVLCAVFIPVSFLPGITGQLYRQFTVTIAVSSSSRQSSRSLSRPSCVPSSLNRQPSA